MNDYHQDDIIKNDEKEEEDNSIQKQFNINEIELNFFEELYFFLHFFVHLLILYSKCYLCSMSRFLRDQLLHAEIMNLRIILIIIIEIFVCLNLMIDRSGQLITLH